MKLVFTVFGNNFLQAPLHDFKLPLKYLQDWFPEEVVAGKRQELACLIRSLMEEQGINVHEIGLPTLTFTNYSSTGVSVTDGVVVSHEYWV